MNHVYVDRNNEILFEMRDRDLQVPRVGDKVAVGMGYYDVDEVLWHPQNYEVHIKLDYIK